MFENILKFFKKDVADLSNRLILFIDDSELDRRYIERILTKKNFRVLLASNGEQGLKTAQEQKPNLVLLDVVLPGLSGIEICKKLKKDEITKHIPIIFLTGMDTPKNLIDCYEYGAEDFLNKSIHPKALISQIEYTLKEFSTYTNS